jgi:hypothetical protein
MQNHRIHFSISSPLIFLGVPYGVCIFFLFTWIISLPVLKIINLQQYAIIDTLVLLSIFLFIRKKSKNNPYYIATILAYYQFFFHPKNLKKKRYKYFFKKKFKFYA